MNNNININNKGQSNLAMDGIAANWGFSLANLLFSKGTAGPCLIQCVTSVPAKRHPIESNGFSTVHGCDRRTDHATVTSVTIGGMACSDAA